MWDLNNNFYQEFVAWTIQWNCRRHSRQWFNDLGHTIQSCLRRVSCKPLYLPHLCISVVLLQLFCSSGKLQLQPKAMAGLPWARDSGTGTRQMKPYDWTPVGPFHATSGGKSTICLEQTAARASHEQMAIYTVKEKSFVSVLLLLAHEQWLFQQRNPPPPSESHWF